MSKAEWFGQPYSERRIEADTAIHHHIPFPWGSFQVSVEANEAYGIVPLNSDQAKGAHDTSQQKPKQIGDIAIPLTNIYLLGPNELIGAYPQDKAYSEARLSLTGISIAVSFKRSVAEIQQAIAD